MHLPGWEITLSRSLCLLCFPIEVLTSSSSHRNLAVALFWVHRHLLNTFVIPYLNFSFHQIGPLNSLQFVLHMIAILYTAIILVVPLDSKGVGYHQQRWVDLHEALSLLDISEYISKDVRVKLSGIVLNSATSSLGQVILFLHLEYDFMMKLPFLGCCVTGNHPRTKQAR